MCISVYTYMVFNLEKCKTFAFSSLLLDMSKCTKQINIMKKQEASYGKFNYF